MHYTEPRRVAIIGGMRIPFSRAHTAYAKCSNQDMMTAVLRRPGGEVSSCRAVALGDVSLGAVIKHSRDWNLARECVLGSGCRRGDTRVRPAACLRHQSGGALF